jgi:ABC-2 type transport system permease protein
MNAPVKAMPHPTHKFKLLLRREFWEHKGGFLWAPLVAGGIFLLLSLMGFGVGEMAARRASGTINVDGEGFQINGLDLGAITSKMDAEQIRNLGQGVDLSLLMASAWPLIVLAFVVFFYCLGTLYDERKDRSVLFWKSLPLSDRETVLSKAASALVVAPVIATIAALATMLGFLLVASGVVLVHGGNPVQLLWGPGSPFAMTGRILACIPVYALWALPTVGWLMLCSAWARSKPFLWAIMIPVFAGIFVTWFDLMQLFDLESSWFWSNIVRRALLGTVPGGWILDVDLHGTPDTLDRIGNLLSPATTYAALATPQLWIGAAAGAAMIFGAIRLRRWRDEG